MAANVMAATPWSVSPTASLEPGRYRARPSLRIRKEDQHDQFEEAFARYLPQPIRNNRNNPMESPLCADSGSETPGG
ncbi:MAG: hypothetical protein GY835_28420 [bacterium]|nr:hypothetical protein [bacterium]